MHTLLSFPVNDQKGKLRSHRLTPLTRAGLRLFRERCGDMQLLIIDEVSMVSAEMLWWVHTRLGELFGCTNVPFGGCSIILLGDLCQLPPVEGQWVFKSALWREFKFSELVVSERHKTDAAFGGMCTRLREHHPRVNPLLSDEDWKLLESLVTPEHDLEPEYVRLYCRVAGAEACNARDYRRVSLAVAPQPPVTIFAADSSFGNDRLGVRAESVHQAQYMTTSQTGGIPTRLQLAVGMVVGLTCNIDQDSFLVNGQRGQVLGYDTDDSGSVVKIHIKFYDTLAGQPRKSIQNRFSPDAVPISVFKITFDLGSGRRVTRIGFPLVPATAMTIHKSQGQTYTKFACDLRGVFAPGQGYVGISRGTGSAGTRIVNALPRESLYCDEEVLQEMERLRRDQVPPPITASVVQPQIGDVVSDPFL